MAVETSTILRGLLLAVKRAKTLEEAILAVETFCTGDDVAFVNEQILKMKKLEIA